MDNFFFGRDDNSGLVTFFGVVEDRNDPLQQGRVRVRCFGFHSDDRLLIPTDHLPWATVLLPTTSASVTGVGISPTGLVVGSHVFGLFLDGRDCQKPLVIGSIPSSSVATPVQIDQLQGGGALPAAGGSGYNAYSTIQNTPTSVATGEQLTNIVANSDDGGLEGVSTGDRSTHLALVRSAVSAMTRTVNLVVIHCTASTPNANHDVEAIRQYHMEGRAQEGLEPFTDIGYHIVIRRSGEVQLGRPLNTPGAHARGYNQNSIGVVLVGGIDYDRRPEANFTAAQWESLRGVVDILRSQLSDLQIIGHNQVSNKACPSFDVQSWLRDIYPENVVSDTSALSSNGTDNLPGADEVEPFGEDVAAGQAIENPYSLENRGFADPAGEFPRPQYLANNHPDTNFHATSSNSAPSIEVQNSTRVHDVPVAIPASSSNRIEQPAVWTERPSTYDARYPFNHVMETESGHIIEYDDSPGHERIRMFHRGGSFWEMNADGSYIHRTTGGKYEVVGGTSHLLIRGNANILVEGNGSVEFKGDVAYNVGGNLQWVVSGDWDVQVDGDVNFNIYGSRTTLIAGNDSSTTQGSSTDLILGNTSIATLGTYQLQSEGNTSFATDGTLSIHSIGNAQYAGQGSIHISTADALSIASSGSSTFTAAGGHAITGGGYFAGTASLAVALGGSVGSSSASVLEIESTDITDPREENEYYFSVPIATEFWCGLFEEPEDPLTNQHVLEGLERGMYTVDPRTTTPSSQGTTPVASLPSVTSASYIPQVPGATGATPRDVTNVPQLVNPRTTGVQLSPNFSLASLSSGAVVSHYAIRAQRGLTEDQIIENLRFVAINVCEPIRAQFPTMFVTSGFRHERNGSSQHEIGQAVDMQFGGVAVSEYYDIAVWIRDHINFDQLLLEYKDQGTRIPWIHVSCKNTGNRGVYHTFFNHSMYARNQLVNLG